jgi:hypothetical protein
MWPMTKTFPLAASPFRAKNLKMISIVSKILQKGMEVPPIMALYSPLGQRTNSTNVDVC